LALRLAGHPILALAPLATGLVGSLTSLWRLAIMRGQGPAGFWAWLAAPLGRLLGVPGPSDGGAGPGGRP
jgi:hypothetical protein